jgi:hypothetical protein
MLLAFLPSEEEPKSSAGTVLLIWAVRSFINGSDNKQSRASKFVFRLPHSRCDFSAVISAQKMSAETVRPPEDGTIFFYYSIFGRHISKVGWFWYGNNTSLAGAFASRFRINRLIWVIFFG